MKSSIGVVLCTALLMQSPAGAVSKHPPGVPVTMESGRLVADLRLLLADTNNLDLEFNERSRWHKQTVSNTLLEFCVIEDGGVWQIQDPALCLARRNTEEPPLHAPEAIGCSATARPGCSPSPVPLQRIR